MADGNITVDVLNLDVAIRMREALAELVRLEDEQPEMPRGAWVDAWAAARAALAEQPSAREPLTDEQIKGLCGITC